MIELREPNLAATLFCLNVIQMESDIDLYPVLKMSTQLQCMCNFRCVVLASKNVTNLSLVFSKIDFSIIFLLLLREKVAHKSKFLKKEEKKDLGFGILR